jgi:hypothetical protein
MATTAEKAKEWYQSLSAPQRYDLVKRHNEQMPFTDKQVVRMYRAEFGF